MNYIEIVAAILGIASVYFIIKQKIWAFPLGIMMASLYIFVFYNAKLYSDMLLQIFYVFLQTWAWIQWSKGNNDGKLLVSWLDPKYQYLCLVLLVLGAYLLGTFMYKQTDAALPYIDASLTASSLVAQGLLTYKKIENWIIWIIADIVYVFVYMERQLPYTAALYAIFLLMAIAGLREWLQVWRKTNNN